MNAVKISDIERRLEELPLLPSVVARLMALSPNDENYFEEILRLSEEDPPFALRLIKVANCSSSAPVTPVTNLHAAVVRIGARQIANLVMSVAVTRVFVPSTQGERNLWIHSLETAMAARTIARIARPLGLDPEEAYLCGLMHDIGRFVLFKDATEDLAQVDESGWSTPKQLVESEQKTYGFDHAELGWRACRKWCLPDRIADVVRYHHVFELPQDLSGHKSTTDLVHVVQMADFFSVFAMLNPDFAEWSPQEVEDKLKERCILPSCSHPPVSARELLQHAPGIVEDSKRILTGLGIRTAN